MALVDKLDEKPASQMSKSHTDTKGTFTRFKKDGETFLQIDTYGSVNREKKDSQSQTIRFTPNAIKQLKKILETF